MMYRKKTLGEYKKAGTSPKPDPNKVVTKTNNDKRVKPVALGTKVKRTKPQKKTERKPPVVLCPSCGSSGIPHGCCYMMCPECGKEWSKR